VTAVVSGLFTNNFAGTALFGATITCSACSLIKVTSLPSTESFDSGTGAKWRVSFAITGVLIPSNSSANLKISTVDTIGYSAGNAVTFTGTVLIQRVGSVVAAATA